MTRKKVLTPEEEANNKIIADFRNLTEKQRQLITRFLKTGNKLASYKAVYYPNPTPNTSATTVYRGCYNEFRKPHIKLIISQIREKAVKMANIGIDDLVDGCTEQLLEAQKEVGCLAIDSMWVLKRAALLADFNINKFVKVENGEAIYDFSTASDDDWYCIQEVTQEVALAKDGETKIPVNKIKIKSYDKLRALELVGKHVDIGAFKDKIEVSGDKDSPLVTIIRGDDANL